MCLGVRSCRAGQFFENLYGKVVEMTDALSKSDILSLIFRLGCLSAASYFSMKWLISHLDPTTKQNKAAQIKAVQLLKRLGIKNVKELSVHEMVIASHLVDPDDICISWYDIAGLDDVIQELKETVILPIRRKDLFANSLLTRAPKGVLLFGPPGCGKTLIAKATAKEAGTRFINLDVSMLTDKWYGESQKLASAVFTLSRKLQPCIIFIDEIDSFLRNRNSQDHEATAMMKAQFMSLWDGLITDPNCTVIVMGATNRPHDLDRAILRRMPATFHISLPNLSQRRQILDLILKHEPTSNDVNLDDMAKKTEGFSGSDLKELCRNASIYRVRDYFNHKSNLEKSSSKSSSAATSSLAAMNADNSDAPIREISNEDLMMSLSKMRESKLQCGTLQAD